ncbi:diguanylate cyclase domain-containing protein [Anabaena azotica]|uniref:diguanylate cyclase domain-containing protein n=1 Tax=Anabaena azotica TaxID=197653 RepID=UPI0039A6EDBB
MIEQKNREIIAYKQQLEQAQYEYNRFTKVLVTANQDLQSGVLLDPLTRLANRKKFDEYLNLQWQKLAREKSPISLLLCNVDFLKNCIDADDHLTTDRYLQLLATKIKSVVKRSTDLVASYDNKKFAVILPNTDSKGAVYVGKLIQGKVDYLKINHFPFRNNESFTLSIGVATIFPNVKMLPNSLVDMVEKAVDTIKF